MLKRLVQTVKMSPSALTINSAVQLNTGYELPRLGFGVYKTPPAETEACVLHAFKNGYRHVDSAVMYQNEAACSTAISKSSIPRSSIFFTTKVEPAAIAGGYLTAKASIDKSLANTGLSYVDLWLLHSPSGTKADRNGAWKALAEAQAEGKIRSIGVSNYGLHHLRELEAYIKELEKEESGKGGKISVAQYELHPWCGRADIVAWCQERDIVMEAYCPIVRGTRAEDSTVQALSKKYSKTPAQILIRWSLQKGFVPLPKSATPSRIVENAEVFDFELSDEEMKGLETDEYSPCAWDPTVWKDAE